MSSRLSKSDVTSVGLTAPADFTVSGSPIIQGGNLGLARASEGGNLVLASPSGASGAPSFRALVPGDLPLATASAVGAVQPDGSTITVSSGVISAASSSGSAWVPADSGLLAWSWDPVYYMSISQNWLQGYVYVIRVRLGDAATVHNVVCGVDSAGAGMTNCYVGLYTTAGTLVASSANISTTLQSTGIKSIPLTTPYAAGAGDYFVGFLMGGHTTWPNLWCFTPGPGYPLNANVTGGNQRIGYYGSGTLTSLPTPLTLSSIIGSTTQAPWVGLS